MFCKNCGKKLVDDAKFCSECGHITDSNSTGCNVIVNGKDESITYNKKALAYSFYISLVNAPIMLILRILCGKTKTAYGWREHTVNYLPNNIKAVMLILMVGFVAASMFLKKESGANDKKVTRKIIISNIIETIISLIIIFTT